MPRSKIFLGVILLAVPWTFAESVNNENTTSGITTRSRNEYSDDTRREEGQNQSVTLLDPVSEATTEQQNEEKPSPFARTFNVPSEELTGFETDVTCNNAQFLMKVFTVLVPLLRGEVPASTRTSYILYILKDLLKKSPEAYQDHDIMYKINDLLIALDKYHNKHLLPEHSALRTTDNEVSNPVDVKSNIAVKFEVPQLTNPDCTAELLRIIHTVQQAIKELVNNPLCKSEFSTKMADLINVDEYFLKPEINSYEKPVQPLPWLPKVKNWHSPKEYEILGIDFPGNHKVNEMTVYSKIPKSKFTTVSPMFEELVVRPEQSDFDISKIPVELPYSYDMAPNILSLEHGVVKKPDYIPIETVPYSSSPSPLELEFQPVSKYDVHPDYFKIRPYKNPIDYESIYDTKPEKKPAKIPEYIDYPNYDVDILPSKPQELYEKIREYGTKYPSSNSPQPYSLEEVFKKHKPNNYIPHLSTEFDQLFIPQEQNPIYEYDFDTPTTQPPFLDIYGIPNSAEIELSPLRQVQPTPSALFYDLPSYENTPNSEYSPLNRQPASKNPPQYAVLPQHMPLIKGKPVLPSEPKPHKPFSFDDSPITRPNEPGYYIPYLPNSNINPNFEVFGDGSGEIQFKQKKPSIADLIEYRVPKKEKEISLKPYTNYDKPRIPLFDYDYIETHETLKSPELYWPEQDSNEYVPEIPMPFETYTPNEENMIVSQVTTAHPFLPDIENQYIIKKPVPYPENSGTDNKPNFNFPDENEPIIWNLENVPETISPQVIPDNKILHIIKDNIKVMEEKIPSEYMTGDIVDLITKLKKLLGLEQVTIEEYVNTINQYQYLIEYLKHLDISNAIMQDLLMSMTNLDKLDLLTGKSQVIELTYLIKRPKPLIYQPYYYIKYRLPYESFLNNVDTLLAEQPHLAQDPEELYKALITMSKVAETSPDLERYGKEDILRLTFNKGTLVGAKVLKGQEQDLYSVLDTLKNANSDVAVEDIYHLIENLDIHPKETLDNVDIDNTDTSAFNVYNRPDKIRITKLQQHPIIQKITKITTNKAAADDILENIMKNVDFLRSNYTDHKNEELAIVPLEGDINTNVNNEFPSVARSKDMFDFSQLSKDYITYEPAKYSTKTDIKQFVPDDYLKTVNVLNHFDNNNNQESYIKHINTDFAPNWNGVFSNDVHTDNELNKLERGKWVSEIIESYDNSPKNLQPNLVSNIIDPVFTSEIPSQPKLHPITAVKLLEATLKADKEHNRINKEYNPHNYIESNPQRATITREIISPFDVTSQIVKQSKTYINDYPVKHSKSYIVQKPETVTHVFESSNLPVKYDKENLQSFNKYTQYIDGNDGSSESIETNLRNQYQTQTINNNMYSSDNNILNHQILSDDSFTNINSLNQGNQDLISGLYPSNTGIQDNQFPDVTSGQFQTNDIGNQGNRLLNILSGQYETSGIRNQDVISAPFSGNQKFQSSHLANRDPQDFGAFNYVNSNSYIGGPYLNAVNLGNYGALKQNAFAKTVNVGNPAYRFVTSQRWPYRQSLTQFRPVLG